jgi:hypothetical protein
MSSAASSGQTAGFCNPLLGNGSVNTFPHVGPCCESSDVINSRDGVFRDGLCRVFVREGSDRVSSRAVTSQS